MDENRQSHDCAGSSADGKKINSSRVYTWVLWARDSAGKTGLASDDAGGGLSVGEREGSTRSHFFLSARSDNPSYLLHSLERQPYSAVRFLAAKDLVLQRRFDTDLRRPGLK